MHRWNAYVVPYGASGPIGDPEGQMRAFFAKCPEAKGKRYLLFLGRIHRKKGCDLLIDAFATQLPIIVVDCKASTGFQERVATGTDHVIWTIGGSVRGTHSAVTPLASPIA